MTDKEILRILAIQIAEISSLPVQNIRRENWRKVNNLTRGVKPALLVFQEPWHELNFDGALALHCADPFLRTIENRMRQILFKWKHFQADMVVDAFWDVSAVTNFSTFCGLAIEENTLSQDNRGGIVSHSYQTLFESIDDIEKIKMLDIIYDEVETMRQINLLDDCIGDILPVKLKKISAIWFAPWDVISMWYNPMDILMDLMLKPELMHAIMDRYTQAMLYQLDQLESNNLLSLCNDNCHVGSGGLGYTTDLPGKNYNETYVRPADQWGSATAQIFAEVSPDMHEEFALQYERRWLERFGLTYYGCCEPLHNKLSVLKSVKNLRKISCSPWNNLEKTVEAVDGQYVLSIKLNPAVVATPAMNCEQFRKDFDYIMDLAGNYPCEIIFKDISTCQNDVLRITKWVDIVEQAIGQ